MSSASIRFCRTFPCPCKTTARYGNWYSHQPRLQPRALTRAIACLVAKVRRCPVGALWVLLRTRPTFPVPVRAPIGSWQLPRVVFARGCEQTGRCIAISAVIATTASRCFDKAHERPLLRLSPDLPQQRDATGDQQCADQCQLLTARDTRVDPVTQHQAKRHQR